MLEIIVRLQVHPELGAVAEESCEANSDVLGDVSPVGDDPGYLFGWDAAGFVQDASGDSPYSPGIRPAASRRAVTGTNTSPSCARF